MPKRSPFTLFFLVSLLAWMVPMGILIHRQFFSTRSGPADFTSDVNFTSEDRYYYTIQHNGQKVGYRSESWISRPNMRILVDATVLKMNLSGLSREVFLQSVVAVDSTTGLTRNMSFTLGTGAHSYAFDGALSGDSLAIKVKKNTLDPERAGVFVVDPAITSPSTLPFYLHLAEKETMSYQVFDPVIFSEYLVHAEREKNEIRMVDGARTNLTRFDVLYNDSRGTYWLDRHGRPVRVEGFPLFGGLLGDFTIEKASGQDVFMLPIEVTFGGDILKELSIVPDRPVQNPRVATSMEVELDGIRAANIDISDTHKEYLSSNPVVFRIHNVPVMTGDRLAAERELAYADTAVIGTSDYVQPKDARIIRAARDAIGAETDTLAMALALRRFVTESMSVVDEVTLTRSVDILRERKGGCDEYTKLLTALARSAGIRTRIHLGLVYRDGAFRYHSWPSVFAGGTWHAMDPYFGQDRADATHITLVIGDFERLVDLIRISGLISIKIRDVR